MILTGGACWLLTIRETKKGLHLDNKSKELEIDRQREDSAINTWKEIAENYKQEAEEARNRRDSNADRIDELNEQVKQLMNEKTSMAEELGTLRMLRCNKTGCTKRIPPYGSFEAEKPFKPEDLRNMRMCEDDMPQHIPDEY